MSPVFSPTSAPCACKTRIMTYARDWVLLLHRHNNNCGSNIRQVEFCYISSFSAELLKASMAFLTPAIFTQEFPFAHKIGVQKIVHTSGASANELCECLHFCSQFFWSANKCKQWHKMGRILVNCWFKERMAVNLTLKLMLNSKIYPFTCHHQFRSKQTSDE